MDRLLDWFDNILFNIGDYEVTIGKIAIVVFILFGLFLSDILIISRVLPTILDRESINKEQRKQFIRMINLCFILLAIAGIVFFLQLDQILYQNDSFTIRVSTILLAILIFQIARLLDLFVTRFLLKNYYKTRKGQVEKDWSIASKESEPRAQRTTQYIVYVLAVILILQGFVDENSLIPGTDFRFSNIFKAILILLLARLASWILIQLVLFSYYRRNRINLGTQFAINQLLTYFLYVLASLMALESLGVKLTAIWVSASALLVGVGLGLQQTFNDLVSGIILLFERTVEVGDVIEIDGLIGTVRKIGIRTSIVESRDKISVIVPNSKLITNNVVNWSHIDNTARFNVSVGVAYGSDIDLVKKALMQVAKETDSVLKYPPPFVRFTNFGDSSLDFELFFFSEELIRIEDVKSDLRFGIDRIFRENDIQIPFPQRDIWFKNAMNQSESSNNSNGENSD